jgi:hypothetical protein
MATREDTFTEEATVNLEDHTPTGSPAGTGWTLAEQTGTRFLRILLTNDFVKANSGELNDRYLATMQPNPSVDEYDVEAQLLDIDTNGAKPFFLLARYTDTNNYYSGGLYDANDAQIYKKVSGTVTNIASEAATWLDNDVIKFEIRDATKKVFENAVEVASTTDNALTASGQVGMGVGNAWVASDDISSVWEIDNFSYTEAAAAVSSLTPQRSRSQQALLRR